MTTLKHKIERRIVMMVLILTGSFYHSVHAATIYFNVVYSGTVSTSSISNITNVVGSGFSFSSLNPADPTFVATGNDISGTLSYINGSNQVITINGIISRQNKSGSITNGLFFYPSSNPTLAYILVIPGRESQFISGQSYGSSSDTGNTVVAMNEILTTQETQPVLQISSPTATEGEDFLFFDINFTNNTERTGASSFNLESNPGSASLTSDFTSNMQYSFDLSTWTNISGSLSFPTSEELMRVRVPLVNDTIKECTESMTLEAGSVSGGNVLNNGGAFGVGKIYDQEDYYVWLGGISTEWNNSDNWMCGEIPVSGGNVVVSSTASNDLILDQNRIIGYLKFCDANKKVKPLVSTLTISIAYHPNNQNYIQTTDIGKLNIHIPIAITKLLPVGNSTYNPLVITNNSNADDYFKLRVLDEMYDNGYDGAVYDNPRVMRTWDIHKENPNGGSGVDFIFNWNSGEDTNLLNPKMLHFNGNLWEAPLGQSTATVNSFTFTNYTGSFSPFGISDGGLEMAVTLNYFTIQCEKDIRTLLWQTATESNSDKFVVERSDDGIIWTKLDEIISAGQSTETLNYSFTDIGGRSLHYYRLIQVDFDGKKTFYGPIANNCESDQNNVTIFPNPTGGDFSIRMDVDKTEIFEIKITGVDGRTLQLKIVEMAEGANLIPVDANGFSAGNYILTIQNEQFVYKQNLVIH